MSTTSEVVATQRTLSAVPEVAEETKPQKCAQCKQLEFEARGLRKRIRELEHQNERLTYAVQRDSGQYERRAVHGPVK